MHRSEHLEHWDISAPQSAPSSGCQAAGIFQPHGFVMPELLQGVSSMPCSPIYGFN